MRFPLTVLVAFTIASVAIAAPPKHMAPQSAAKVGEIDGLFVDLSKVDNEEEAKPIEEKIMAAFLRSGSPTVDLLMARAAASLNGGDTDTAKKLLGSVNDIAPEFAEAWHQRGILQAGSGDDQGAMFCLEKTVSLNPRHFEAMAELARELEEYGDKPGALRLYRKALALDPHFDDIARKERQLAHEVEGESL